MNLDDRIGQWTLAQVVKFVGTATEAFTKVILSSASERKGGQFFLLRIKPREGYIMEIGQGPDQRLEKLGRTAVERGIRLLDNLPLDHVSSYQSRNPKEGKLGGAILGEEFILSFSGLSELEDEAVVLAVGYRLRLISTLNLLNIYRMNRNPYFETLNQLLYFKEP